MSVTDVGDSSLVIYYGRYLATTTQHIPNLPNFPNLPNHLPSKFLSAMGLASP